MSVEGMSNRGARVCFAQTLAVLLLGVIPLPAGWTRARAALDNARSNEMNRSDRESNAGGYYEGLIGVDKPQGGPNALSLCLLGKPRDWGRFRAAGVSRDLDGDFLMFELRPNVSQPLFGEQFKTNEYGMRDRSYSLDKPPETFRIAVLGSSIDMGWGVGAESMYVTRLEEWLNCHAAKRGLSRRFEVLNFAVAAYSPLQRLESFRRKVGAFQPDLVLYSATMLDMRLMEIHICDMFECRVDLGYSFLRREIHSSGLRAPDFRIGPDEKLREKDMVKRRLQPHYWPIYDATMAALEADCRSAGIPLACIIVPRVGKADAPRARAETVERLKEVLGRHSDSLFDLSGTFDARDTDEIEIAPWDDHPNNEGHYRLFRALADALVNDTLYETLFGSPGPHGPVPRKVVEAPSKP